jgi:CopG family nickel-responsive transcriptional regulator
MQRVTISMSDKFATELEQFMADSNYKNRSEAMRDLARLGLERAKIENPGAGQCLATLVYVFDHNVRELPKRLSEAFHQHHDLSVSTLHVHLDHDNCLEVAVLRGDGAAVKAFSQAIIAERGIQHGQVNFVPVEIEETEHSHPATGAPRRHDHVHPKG